MNFDEKDMAFLKKIKDCNHDKIFAEFQSLQKKYQDLNKHPKINKKKLEAILREIKYSFNPNKMYERLGVDPLSIHVAENLLPVADPFCLGSTLVPKIHILRKQLTDEYGYILQNVRILDSVRIDDYGFEIYVRGKKVCDGKITELDLEQNDVTEIIMKLYGVCFDYVHYIMTKIDVLKLIEVIKTQDPTLVDDIMPQYITACDLKRICANLIQRKIGIKDIVFIFELLNENVRHTQNIDELTDILAKELSFV